MTATDSQISHLRRMTAEPTTETYSDETLAGYIESYPCVDENGESPRVPSTLTPGVMMVNPDWTATYDLHSAAAAIWEEKAGAVSHKFDFSADGGNYSRSQMMTNARRMAAYHLSRRNPSTIRLVTPEARERTFETNHT